MLFAPSSEPAAPVASAPSRLPAADRRRSSPRTPMGITHRGGAAVSHRNTDGAAPDSGGPSPSTSMTASRSSPGRVVRLEDKNSRWLLKASHFVWDCISVRWARNVAIGARAFPCPSMQQRDLNSTLMRRRRTNQSLVTRYEPVDDSLAHKVMPVVFWRGACVESASH